MKELTDDVVVKGKLNWRENVLALQDLLDNTNVEHLCESNQEDGVLPIFNKYRKQVLKIKSLLDTSGYNTNVPELVTPILNIISSDVASDRGVSSDPNFWIGIAEDYLNDLDEGEDPFMEKEISYFLEAIKEELTLQKGE